MADPIIRGYLILTVEEASGKTQKDQFTWDTSAGGPFEAFVKGMSSDRQMKLVLKTTK